LFVKNFVEINGETWVLSDRNIFVLSSDRKSIDREIIVSSVDSNVTSVMETGGKIYAIASDEVYSSSNGGIDWVKNDGFGLPREAYEISSIFNILIVSGNDGVYYSNFDSGSWKKADFYDSLSAEVQINEQVSSLIVSGIAFCLIGNMVYRSFNGILWR